MGKCREQHMKQIGLEEARKAGLAPPAEVDAARLAPAEVDEDGKEINPHIPQYMSSAPWYLKAEKPVSYDGKRDRWNGYDPSTYHRVIELRKKHLKEQQIKKLEEKNNNQEGNDQ